MRSSQNVQQYFDMSTGDENGDIEFGDDEHLPDLEMSKNEAY